MRKVNVPNHDRDPDQQNDHLSSTSLVAVERLLRLPWIYYSSRERWIVLVSLLSAFGFQTADDDLILHMDEGEGRQIRRVLQFVETLVQGKISARYYSMKQVWKLSLG
ncbi:MAG TPA: hypothetical protein VJ044_13195 [Candidatus Hodarchaeales archaeon]|nr:hypothetical protein [Candidatus Hodarchaeales archaeon]